MHASLVRLVRDRASHRCEYCRLAQDDSVIPFEIDHVVALKHHGLTVEENLALSCFYCNSSKGPNIAGIDPESGAVTPLFHPRRDGWDDHFRWLGAILVGTSAVARTTIDVLDINESDRVALRASLMQEGRFPP